MLIPLLIFLALVASLGTRWVLVLVNRTVERRIQGEFRAAAVIAADGSLPTAWHTRIEQKVLRRRRLTRALSRHDLSTDQQARLGRRYALARLGRFENFFKQGAFFDGDEARDLFMEQIAAARRGWESQSWPPRIAPEPVGSPDAASGAATGDTHSAD